MPTDHPVSAAEISAAVTKAIHDHWRMFLVEGIVLVAFGMIAIILPLLAGLATTIILGWLLLLGGAVGLGSTFRARHAPGYGWSTLSALVAVVAGGAILWLPWHGLATLTYVLIAFFIVDGILTIILALEHRRELSGRWEWMMVGGVMDLVLAAIIISGLPGTLAWALGLLVGIDLVWGGVSLIGIALAARAEAG